MNKRKTLGEHLNLAKSGPRTIGESQCCEVVSKDRSYFAKKYPFHGELNFPNR